MINAHLLRVFWEIEQTILKQQKKMDWGAKIKDLIASDLKLEFVDMSGLSLRNLKYMQAFALPMVGVITDP